MSILCCIRLYLEKNSECFKQAQENKELKKPLKLTCCAPRDPITNAPLCVCVPVCMCVFLYSSTCWFFPAARCLWHTWDVWISNLLLWVLLGASAKFLHLYFWIYHISPQKLRQKLQLTATGEKTNNIMLDPRKDDRYWYRI